MACSGCSKKRKRVHLTDAPLKDSSGKVISDSFLTWSNDQRKQRKIQRRIAKRASFGSIVESKQLRNIEILPRTRDRINILKHSQNEKAVYIIGHFKNCSACRYMHRLLDKCITPLIKLDISFYSIEKNDVQPNGFKFRNNPTIVFIDHGKTIRQIEGINQDLNKIIKDFHGKERPKKTKQNKKIKNQLVYKLKPNPTFIKAYEKLLAEFQENNKTIKNVTTFLDEKENLLVVTINL